MTKYHKKRGDVVEAFQYQGTPMEGITVLRGLTYLQSFHGSVLIRKGDYIVVSPDGGRLRMTSEDFEKEYERVDESRDQRILSLLKELEWSRIEDVFRHSCPSCTRYESYGHTPSCELKAMIDELEASTR